MDRSVEKLSEEGDLLPEELLGSLGAATASTGEEDEASRNSSRQPFTKMSQVDADLALARALQQQERAYLLLHLGNEGSEYDTSGSGSVDYEYVNEGDEDQDVADIPQGQLSMELSLNVGHEDDDVEGEDPLDGSQYENDEAFARALQEAEHRNAQAYMMGLIGVEGSDGEDDDSYGSQEAWQDVDPDNMSYEELVALGEAVGTHSRGLKQDVIDALPYSKYVASSSTSDDPCVICRFEYEDGDMLSTLPCKHHYHSDCIKNWLQINKVCPICSAEVSP